MRISLVVYMHDSRISLTQLWDDTPISPLVLILSQRLLGRSRLLGRRNFPERWPLTGAGSPGSTLDLPPS